MHLPEEAELLRVFIGDGDRYHHKPLYEAIVEAARERHLAGATVLRGYLGYGAHSRIHTAKILRLSEDLPVVVEIVDEAEKIEAFLPVLDEMMAEGMVTVEPVRVITYRHHAGDAKERRARRQPAGRPQAPAMAALASLTSVRAAAQASSGVAARVTASMSALPMMTPSARAATPAACSDVEIPKPTASGASVRSRRRASSARQLGADLGARAGHAGHGDAVDERGGRGGDEVQPRVGARGRRHRHQRDAGAGGEQRQSAGLARE